MSTHALSLPQGYAGSPQLTWPRHSRRALLAGSFILACMCLVAVELQWLREAQRQFRAIQIINGLGGRVQYEWRLAPQLTDVFYSTQQKHCFVFPGDSVAVAVRLESCQEPGLDDKLATLSALRHVRCMSLGGSRISDAVLSQLGSLKTLEYLDLSRTPTSDAGICSLARANSLERLNLAQTLITDQSLSTVGRLRQLKWLNVRHTGVTSAGLNVLRARSPGLQIDNDFDDLAASPFVAEEVPWNGELFQWLTQPAQQ